MEPELQHQNPSKGQGHFATTHWTVVVAAAQTRSPEADQALDQLCRQYWYPLYTWLRRKGYAAPDAEDLLQEFFSRRIVTRLIFKGVQPEEGKFRTWLLTSLQNLARNEWDKRQALKRGGEQRFVPLETGDAEERYAHEPSHEASPERMFDRAWAMTLLERTLCDLENTYAENGKEAVFLALKPFLPGAFSRHPLAEVAAGLGKSEEAIKMAISRLRQEYGRILLGKIRQTVSNDSEVQSELQHLLIVLGN